MYMDTVVSTFKRSSRMRYFLFILVGLLSWSFGSGQENKGMPDTATVVYKKAGDASLTLKIYYPGTRAERTGKRYPAIVFFFGGGWVTGSPVQFEKHAAYFTSRGMVSILADYRTKSRNNTTPFDAVMDAKSAIRYVRKNAMLLHVDTGRIAAAGGSAGGHLAAAAATLKGLNDPSDDTTVSPRPNALILFNPVIDNGPEGYGYAKVGARYKEISPIDNITGQLPPTIIFLGTKDQLIPVATAELYKKRMEAAGNRCEVFLYEGQKHGFFNYNGKDLKYYRQTVYQADKFLHSLGYIKDEPTIIQ